MAPLIVVCVVTGSSGGGLEHDALALLSTALERAGIAAALASGAPAARGAAPTSAGRNVALVRFSYARGLTVLHAPSEAPLDLRRWSLAAREAAAAASGAAAPPRAGACAALDALDALLADGAPVALSEGAQLTLVAAPPEHHVDDDLLSALLETATSRLVGVCFATVAPPAGATLGRSVEDELRSKHASLSLAAAVAASDTCTYRAVPCTPAAADALVLSLLFQERAAAGAPRLAATLCMPAPLLAGGAGRRLKLTLRPEVLPLHDAVERIKVCTCHGRALLSCDSCIGSDDISHFLALAGKNNVCSVSAKTLSETQWHPNCLAVGRDGVLHLPSFYVPPFMADASAAAARGGAFGAPPPSTPFHALACVPLSSVSEAHLFGTPWVARPADDDDDDSCFDMLHDADVAPASNAVLFAALCGAMVARGSGVLLAAQHNLDTGKSTPFRCLYFAIPAAPNGGVDRDAAAQQADAAEPPPQLLLKRIVAREEVLPPPPAAAAQAVPPAVAKEVARALAASLPDMVGTYDPLAQERGTHRTLAQLVTKSLAPPPRTATHAAEAEALEARERAAGRKRGSGGGKAKRKGH